MLVRILTAAVGLPLLLAIVLLLPPIGTAVLFGLACMIAAYEMLWRTRLWRNKGAVVLTALMGAAVILWSWCKGCGILTGEQLWLSALVGLFVFFSILFCQLLAGHGKVKVQSIAAVLFAGFVYPFMLGALVRLRSMNGGEFYILVAFLLSMVADSGAYFVGRALGKHKLAPVISPKKTVEGAIGGALVNVLAMLGYTLLLNKCFGFAQVNYIYAAIYGLLGAGASIIGDLTLSVIKRQVKIKDYGNLMPGHGGILDRFDSTMMVAPLVEILLLLIPFAVK
ncbi:MAG: phosphatidate cytidylyltransferase [Oscillospiraceae bacterium]|nr:phosphatidate cytidylyltransferase [Oscillospiraceae bacterium]